MAFTSRWTRYLFRAALCALIAVLLLTAILRTETYLYRRRAEHLMADLQSLQLRHSTWPEAERLITRWARYGHYDGACDASFCRYTISLQSPESYLEGIVRSHAQYDIFAAPPVLLCQFIGARGAIIKATFVVQDGLVLRKGAIFTYEVLPIFSPWSSYELIATSRAVSRLTTDDWSFTLDNQLSEHPFYRVQRPGGCTFCMMANVTFATNTPPDQMRSLTTFDFSCLTRLLPCKFLEDIYPASAEWHLYDHAIGKIPTSGSAQDYTGLYSTACSVPVFALSRESEQVFAATSLTTIQRNRSGEMELPSVRLDAILKGKTRYQMGDILHITSQASDQHLEALLAPGKQYLLLSLEPQEDTHFLELERCSIVQDNLAKREQIQKGIAANDALRHSDPRADWFIPE